MNVGGLAKREGRDIGIEELALIGCHLICATHGAEGRREGTARCVLEELTGRQNGLLSHDSRPAHLFTTSIGILDDPMATDEADRLVAFIGDLHGVEKEPPLELRLRVGRRISGLHFDTYSPSYGLRCKGVFLGVMEW